MNADSEVSDLIQTDVSKRVTSLFAEYRPATRARALPHTACPISSQRRINFAVAELAKGRKNGSLFRTKSPGWRNWKKKPREQNWTEKFGPFFTSPTLWVAKSTAVASGCPFRAHVWSPVSGRIGERETREPSTRETLYARLRSSQGERAFHQVISSSLFLHDHWVSPLPPPPHSNVRKAA